MPVALRGLQFRRGVFTVVFRARLRCRSRPIGADSDTAPGWTPRCFRRQPVEPQTASRSPDLLSDQDARQAWRAEMATAEGQGTPEPVWLSAARARRGCENRALVAAQADPTARASRDRSDNLSKVSASGMAALGAPLHRPMSNVRCESRRTAACHETRTQNQPIREMNPRKSASRKRRLNFPACRASVRRPGQVWINTLCTKACESAPQALAIDSTWRRYHPDLTRATRLLAARIPIFAPR